MDFSLITTKKTKENENENEYYLNNFDNNDYDYQKDLLSIIYDNNNLQKRKIFVFDDDDDYDKNNYDEISNNKQQDFLSFLFNKSKKESQKISNKISDISEKDYIFFNNKKFKLLSPLEIKQKLKSKILYDDNNKKLINNEVNVTIKNKGEKNNMEQNNNNINNDLNKNLNQEKCHNDKNNCCCNSKNSSNKNNENQENNKNKNLCILCFKNYTYDKHKICVSCRIIFYFFVKHNIPNIYNKINSELALENVTYNASEIIEMIENISNIARNNHNKDDVDINVNIDKDNKNNKIAKIKKEIKKNNSFVCPVSGRRYVLNSKNKRVYLCNYRDENNPDVFCNNRARKSGLCKSHYKDKIEKTTNNK